MQTGPVRYLLEKTYTHSHTHTHTHTHTHKQPKAPATCTYWRMQNNCTTSDRFKRLVFQRCRLQLVVNVTKKNTLCKYATLYGYETVARWAIILHTPVLRHILCLKRMTQNQATRVSIHIQICVCIHAKAHLVPEEDDSEPSHSGIHLSTNMYMDIWLFIYMHILCNKKRTQNQTT